ncbi:hypothetical protein D5086_008448 [Populus alba]|uniref:Uncharacterized protein n=1 Tax=Populus alba TaxID=43335 RepID=A0ACC4CH42_POPAL
MDEKGAIENEKLNKKDSSRNYSYFDSTPLPDPTLNPAEVPDSVPSLISAASTITRDFGSLKILYEIIKSKRKHYAALDKVKDPSHSQPNIVHGGVKFGCSEITVSQEQEVRAAIVRYVVPKNAISPAASGMRPPHHELKRLRPDPAFEPAPFSIAFKQLVSEQPMVIDVGSSSSQKEEEEQEKG